MQSVRKALLAVALVASLAVSTSAVAADHEPDPRGGRPEKSRITSVIRKFIVQILSDFSFPPPH